MKGNPCHIIILCEATEMTKRVLMEPPTFINEEPRGLKDPAPSEHVKNRITYQYYAILGTDTSGDILMAARVNNCETIELLEAALWVDSIKKERGKMKEQHTKAMVCKFIWRQNVGHVGKQLRLCGVHGYHHTMARRGTEEEFNEWWDRLAEMI